MKKFFLILYMTILPAFLFPQNISDWVKASGECYAVNINTDEAVRIAKNNARLDAIKKVVGIKITGELLDRVAEDKKGISEIFSKLSHSTLSGRIVDEKVISESWSDENGIPKYSVNIEVRVARDDDQPDPNFHVSVKLNKSPAVYYDRGAESDALKFSIDATKDCYIYVFNLMSNDSVQLIMPNEYIRDTKFEVNSDTQEYESLLKRISFHVKTPLGVNSSVESLYVVALKKYYDLSADPILKSKWKENLSTIGALFEIQDWLLKIPVEERTETFISYEIRKIN